MRNRVTGSITLSAAIVGAALLAATGGAQQQQQPVWQTANQVTLAWDAVSPIASGDTIRYQAYVKPAAGGGLVSSGPETAETQAVISFSSEGRYYLCVQALRYPQGETSPLRSEVACSDDPAAVHGGQTFGAVYYVAPQPPSGLRLGGVQ